MNEPQVTKGYFERGDFLNRLEAGIESRTGDSPIETLSLSHRKNRNYLILVARHENEITSLVLTLQELDQFLKAAQMMRSYLEVQS